MNTTISKNNNNTGWRDAFLVVVVAQHRMISYFLSNTSAENYRNRIVCVCVCQNYSKSKVGRVLRRVVVSSEFLSADEHTPLRCLNE